MARLLTGIFLTALAVLAVAVDLTGRWWGDAVNDGVAHPVYVTLIQKGSMLSGSGGPSPNSQDVLQNGRIEGARVTFDIVPESRSPLHFELTIEGEWLKGTMKVRHNGQVVTGAVSLRKRSS